MAMTELIARYRTALDRHLADPLVLVPLVILDFLCIHPFPDGNGRMARLLTLQANVSGSIDEVRRGVVAMAKVLVAKLR